MIQTRRRWSARKVINWLTPEQESYFYFCFSEILYWFVVVRALPLGRFSTNLVLFLVESCRWGKIFALDSEILYYSNLLNLQIATGMKSSLLFQPKNLKGIWTEIVWKKRACCVGEKWKMTFCFIVLFNDEQTNNLHSKLTFISSQLSHYENVEKSLTMKQIFFLPHLICKTKGNPIKKERERDCKGYNWSVWCLYPSTAIVLLSIID